MLSLRILCAVDIINMLHIKHEKENGGMKKAEILSSGCMPLNLYTSVLSELSRGRIIERRASSVYYFARPLSSVTLYDLAYLLHQGVPIGEIVPTQELRGSVNYKQQYQALMFAERALMDDVSRQMRNMKLSDLLPETPSQNNTPA